MAIAFDAATLSSNFDTNNFSFSHTCTGNERLLVVSVHFHDNVNITAATYNGEAMTEVGDRAHSGGGRVFMFYIANPASGSNTIQLTHNTAEGRAHAASYTGIDQDTPLDDSNDDIGDSSAPSVSMVSVDKDNCLLIDAAVWDDDGVAGTMTGDNDNELYDAIAGSGIAQRGLVSEKIGAGAAGSKTMSWSFSGGDLPWALIAAAFMPVQGPSVNDAITVTDVPTVAQALQINPTNPGVKVVTP